ncbi:hypothetical protein [Pseudobdellovibrio exovorus]|uniref:Uncharacterized protein n=1 Tax=Pseudobdellovibrio exovorus JSS TaxID=1184267 RepID=M4VND8_9BACT|nr:hypothetical protein [Pseudobdellovibrio exovorus]AGH94609.1 hypothetical protein A11Q_389 [Pseudobdellovibrio exovorus JSS]
MKTIFGVMLALALTGAFTTAKAQSLSNKIHNPYSSLRALGMGNAFTAVADDYSLIMYNPAGFARKKHNEVQITLAGGGVSSKTMTVVDDIKKASDTPGTDADKAQAVSDVLEKYYGESLGGKLQALEMFWIRRNWGVAILPADLTVDMYINRQVGPALDLNVKGDSILAFGYGHNLTSTLDVGITAKYIHRVSVEEILPAFELATDPNMLSSKRFREGNKIDFDLGFMWTPDWFTKRVARQKVESPATTTSTSVAPPAEATAVDTAPVAETAPETPTEDTAPAETTPTEATADETRTPQSEQPEQSETVVAQQGPENTVPEPVGAITNSAPGTTPVPVPQDIQPNLSEPAQAEEPVSAPAEQKPAVAQDGYDVVPSYPLSFGVVVHNVIGGDFSQSKMINKDAVDKPSKLERTVDVGAQYKIVDWDDFAIRYMIDFRNLGYPGATTFNRVFHTGIEFDYSPNTWFKTQLRAGLNQMYFTAGASFLFGVLNLDIVTYGEEAGTLDQKRESRVTAAKVGFNF